ncbi:MAG TPA: protein phosphatase 2C domain-containing protein [Dehalococcoidales bacterium]|nr:protein phosphatase 2C domain-containing protein [Dehalococcoidales bacterium]
MSPVAQVIPMLKSPDGAATPSGFSIEWRAMSYRGLVRMRNEDTLFIDENRDASSQRFILAIADGLGGHRGGAVASQTAMNAVKDEFHNWHGKGIESFVDRTLRHANEDVFAIAQVSPAYFNMRTTLTVVALEQDVLAVGHIGDCRLYRYRKGTVKQVTRDHSAVNDMARLHLISQKNADVHPNRHQLTRALGADPFTRPDTLREKIFTGDSYLLCSDGLWSEVTPADIKNGFTNDNMTTGFEELIGKVFDAGAHDNVSGILFRVQGNGK